MSEPTGILERLKATLTHVNEAGIECHRGGASMVADVIIRDAIAEIEKLRDDAVEDGRYMEQLSDEVRRVVGVLRKIADDPCHAYAPARAREAIPSYKENELERLRNGATYYMEEIERLRGWYTASQEALRELLSGLRGQTEAIDALREEVRRLDV
jgi:hypothetical protein